MNARLQTSPARPIIRIGTAVKDLFIPPTGLVNWGDRILYNVTRALALFVVLLAILLVVELFQGSRQAIERFGFGFITSTSWDAVRQEFGALPTIVATLAMSLIALAIAVPVSIGSAVFLALYLPAWLRGPISYLVETLAAIPSVIIGLWGMFVLVPVVRVFQEWLNANFSWVALGLPSWVPWIGGYQFTPFDGPASSGFGLLSAGFILAIMIIPIITAISRDLIRAVPRAQTEGMLALGATKWEAVWKSVLPYTRVGLIGAVGLGFGRAIGETMAVLMVAGNAFRMPSSLFDPAYSMASRIASEFADAAYALHVSSLFYIGLCLFGVTIIINLLAQLLVWRISRGGRGAVVE